MHENREEHVSLWHPWADKPGQRHVLTLWEESHFLTVDHMLAGIGGKKQYSFCNDILQEQEVPSDLVLHDKTESFICRTGQMTALKVRYGKNTGFLIPGIVWGYPSDPDKTLLNAIQWNFNEFGYEAITPASLSEKVVRSTLPYKTIISRPAVNLRKTLLEHSPGGRQDDAEGKVWYQALFEYDMVKAYLALSRMVVDPFSSPVHFTHPDSWMDYATSYLLVTMTAHGKGKQPLQIKDQGKMREPKEGEVFTRWCWKEEIFDCLVAGYTLEHVDHGHGWHKKSGFLCQWSDILWEKYQKAPSDLCKDIVKKMMVGLPGRFLKRPETYSLIHKLEAQKGDIPVIANWKENESPLTNWFIRTAYDKDSAQLTQVGSYILMRCRQELYKRMKAEEQAGNTIISSYIDQFRSAFPLTDRSILGKEPGMFKETFWTDVTVQGNRILGMKERQSTLHAPGISGVFRLAVEQEMRNQHESFTIS